MLLVNELDVIRRYLPSLERPKFSTRYSKFQVRHKLMDAAPLLS